MSKDSRKENMNMQEGGWCVGQKVWTSVSVGGARNRMAQGVIVAVHDGYCDVDIMSLHGGAPWIVKQTNSALEAVTD